MKDDVLPSYGFDLLSILEDRIRTATSVMTGYSQVQKSEHFVFVGVTRCKHITNNSSLSPRLFGHCRLDCPHFWCLTPYDQKFYYLSRCKINCCINQWLIARICIIDSLFSVPHDRTQSVATTGTRKITQLHKKKKFVAFPFDKTEINATPISNMQKIVMAKCPQYLIKTKNWSDKRSTWDQLKRQWLNTQRNVCDWHGDKMIDINARNLIDRNWRGK